MKNYPNASDYFSSHLWAIRPEALSIMAEILSMRIAGTPLTAEEIQARIGSGQSASRPTGGQIAVIPLQGVIDQKVNSMAQISGGTSIDEFMGWFRAAVNDDEVKGIVIDVDSPGGNVDGVPEAANEIYNARSKKPIIAVANPQIASAAYWLSCAASEIYSMPSGRSGSIGVIMPHDDVSVANEMAGYRPTFITYGAYKAELNPNIPLSEGAREYCQMQVDAVGDMFTRFIAKARNISVDKVRSEFGQGRMMLAKDAQKVGMIDGIATIEQVITKMGKTQITAIAASTYLASADYDEDEDDNDDEDEENCTCGKADCTICKKNAKLPSVTESTDAVLTGLASTVTSWGGLVDRQIAGGNKLSQNKLNSITNLQKVLGESKMRVDGIIAKYSEPVAAVPNEDKPAISPSLDNAKAKLALTVAKYSQTKI